MSTVSPRLIRSITVLALAMAALLVALPVAAHARYLVHEDAREDVVEIVADLPAPDQANGDIASIRFRHTETRVQVRVRFADLQRAWIQETEVLLMTNEGVKRRVAVAFGSGSWAGTARLYARTGVQLRCAIYRTVDYSENVLTIGLPRTCLSRPRWVQFGARHTTQPWPLNATAFRDDALRDEGVGPYQYLKLSPRLYRG